MAVWQYVLENYCMTLCSEVRKYLDPLPNNATLEICLKERI